MKVEKKAATINTAGRPKFYRSTPDDADVTIASEGAQRTATGYEIPVPAREEFEDLLERVAKKRPHESPSEPD
jgi:hypothetical protein